jgi:hypothetical protein
MSSFSSIRKFFKRTFHSQIKSNLSFAEKFVNFLPNKSELCIRQKAKEEAEEATAASKRKA